MVDQSNHRTTLLREGFFMEEAIKGHKSDCCGALITPKGFPYYFFGYICNHCKKPCNLFSDIQSTDATVMAEE